MPRRLYVIVLACCIAAVAGAQTPELKSGDKVEVREGDTWSPASVVKKEGRRIQIKYDDGTEEWVTGERIRVAGAAGSTGTTPAPAAGTDAKDAGGTKGTTGTVGKPAESAKKPRTQWQVGQGVQAKWGGSWWDATINNKRPGDWYLITYTRDKTQEWVEWYRIRAKTTTTDDIPVAHPNGRYRKGDDPPRADAGDHPKDKETAAKAADNRGGGGGDADFDKPVSERDVTASTEVLPAYSGEWAVAPDPIDPKTATASQPVPLAGDKDIFAKRSIVRGGAMVGISIRNERQGQKTSQFQRINLATGTASTPVAFPFGSEPIAISPDGKRVIGRSHAFGFGKGWRLDLWDVAAGSAQHVISFKAFDKGQMHDTDISAAGFINDTLAWVQGKNGELAVLEIASAKQLWRCKLQDASPVVPSPGGKYLYGVNDNDVICFDAVSGKVLGSISGGMGVRGQMDVTSDGQWLVTSSGQVMNAFDLRSGKSMGDTGLPSGTGAGAVVGLADGYALVGTTLFNIAKRTPVWQYEGGEQTFCAGGKAWTVLNESNRSVLVTAKLPQPSAKAADAKLNDSSFALKPGDKVAIEMAVAAPPEEQQKISEHLTGQLTRAGFVIDPAAPVRIIVRTEDGKTTTQTYGNMMHGPFARGGEPVQVTEKISRVTIEVAGKAAWEARIVATPGTVQRKEGQGTVEAVREANVFNTGFFRSVRLPQYVLKPDAAASLGKSKWALGGVKDAN